MEKLLPFGCVTPLSVMQRGELAWGSLAMTRMPLTTTVLLIMASRREARPDTDACAKTCISTDRCSQVCIHTHTHTHAWNKRTNTHTRFLISYCFPSSHSAITQESGMIDFSHNLRLPQHSPKLLLCFTLTLWLTLFWITKVFMLVNRFSFPPRFSKWSWFKAGEKPTDR